MSERTIKWFYQITGTYRDLRAALGQSEFEQWQDSMMPFNSEDPDPEYVGEVYVYDLQQVMSVGNALFDARSRGMRIDFELFGAVFVDGLVAAQMAISQCNAPFCEFYRASEGLSV